MGIWVAKPRLEADEVVRWEKFANRQQSEYQATGGRLYLTDRRLLFVPNRLDSVTGGDRWSVSSANVREIGVEGREPTIPVAGKAAKLRRRLRIATTTGLELFVINKVNEAVSDLKSALG